MTQTPLPTHDRLGPDPEPLGDRADRRVQVPRRREAERDTRATLQVTGGRRGRIVVTRFRSRS